MANLFVRSKTEFVEKRHRGTQLQEQLEPIARQMKANRLHVKPVSQVLLKILCVSEEDCADKLRADILQWMKKKAKNDFPPEAWNGESFDLRQLGVQHAAAVSLPEQGLWMARQDDADKEVASQTWVTEIGMVKTGKGYIELGFRLQCVSPNDERVNTHTLPWLIKDIITKYQAFVDDRQVKTQSWKVTTKEQVEQLYNFLTDPTRKREVFVITTAAESDDLNTCLIDADRLAWNIAGAGHVVTLTSQASYYLTERIGKEFTVYNQAIRTYRPGFNPDEDEPSQHPVALPSRISNWETQSPFKVPFIDWLTNRALQSTVWGRSLEKEVPSFTDALRLVSLVRLEQARKEGASDTELLEYALKDNEQLIQAKRDSDDLLEVADKENKALSEEKDKLEMELQSERARIKQLSFIIEKQRNKTASESLEIITIPNDLNSIGLWADEYLSGSVILTKSAIKSARDSNFQKPELIYNALIVLRDYYVPMRRGDRDSTSLDIYRSKLAELGLEESASLSNNQYGNMGDAYTRIHEGFKFTLDRHLKGSNSRDDRHSFRLYFCWDENSDQVIVGHLPSHLENRLS